MDVSDQNRIKIICTYKHFTISLRLESTFVSKLNIYSINIAFMFDKYIVIAKYNIL